MPAEWQTGPPKELLLLLFLVHMMVHLFLHMQPVICMMHACMASVAEIAVFMYERVFMYGCVFMYVSVFMYVCVFTYVCVCMYVKPPRMI